MFNLTISCRVVMSMLLMENFIILHELFGERGNLLSVLL